MPETSRLVKMNIRNIGCIGPEGCEVALDDILCLVGGNNTGKSTILRAYELALGTCKFDEKKDLCGRSGGASASIEIWVHIPEGMANIAEKWKVIEGEYRLVRSKWEWSPENDWNKTRSTWNPEIDDYSDQDQASGLDTVFASRLPKPFRIGALEDPQAEQAKLLTFVLQPIADKLNKQVKDESSPLYKAISDVGDLAKLPVDEEKNNLGTLKKDLNRSHNAIFPDLELDFDIGIGEIEIDPLRMLLKNSYLKFKDLFDEVSWSQQGTGSQRALFWTMLQVRSRIEAIENIANENKKSIADLERQIKKLQGEAKKAKKEETKQAKYTLVVEIENKIAELKAIKPEDQVEQKTDEFSLPGYMLLIDEPEIALHPSAIRAASRYLYGLAEDKAWQIMIATHSPLFIDPLHDHTTIVRLDRSEANPSPKTYRSDFVTFSEDEKEELKILNRFDQGLAEMFFGQHPILIEGDTEYAVFETLFNKHPIQFPINNKPVLVRAHGKYTLLLLMRILSNFKVPFSIVHDSDTPYRKDGKSNGSWSANQEIYKAIQDIRAQGINVVHRVSIPNFEYEHLPLEFNEDGELVKKGSKDKPWLAVKALDETSVEASVISTLSELVNPASTECLYGDGFGEKLLKRIQDWGKKNCPDDLRFIGKANKSEE